LSHMFNEKDCSRPYMGVGYETGQLLTLY
jgi:hypothetical protein